MKKTIPMCALSAALAAALAAGCSHDSGYDRSVTFNVEEGGSVYRLLNSSKEFGADEDILFSDSVKIMLPTSVFGAGTESLRDSIMSLAFDSIGHDFDAVMEGYITRTAGQFGYPLEKADATDAMPDGFCYVSGSVVNLSPELMVYRVSTSEYQPRAAHGLTTNFYINYDMARARVLSFADLFDTTKTDSLTAAIQTQADALEQVIGPTTVTALPIRNNFMLSPDGEIVFVYQPYEIASYAQGAIHVSFYPYELVDYMTPFAVKFFRLSDLE